ncbi:DUF6653 family protein [Aestuariibius insulae]|uniref:DUF6653 family protein n=1 Tax=Aestuariibius insulae TaxID=2058287 RepID=UPI00345EE4A8
MDLFSASERLMTMSDKTWARHANRWSVYTRFTCLPLIVLAIWSRVWIGWWAAPLVALAVIWTWYNPRAFPPAQRWDTWAAEGTMGERVFLGHRESIAPHHRRAAIVLTAGSAICLAPLVYGLWALNPWATLLGIFTTIGPKAWFVDRMVWIWKDWEASGKTRADL